MSYAVEDVWRREQAVSFLASNRCIGPPEGGQSAFYPLCVLPCHYFSCLLPTLKMAPVVFMLASYICRYCPNVYPMKGSSTFNMHLKVLPG